MPRPHSLPAHQYVQSNLIDINAPNRIGKTNGTSVPTRTNDPSAAVPVREPIRPTSQGSRSGAPRSQARNGSMAMLNTPRKPIQARHAMSCRVGLCFHGIAASSHHSRSEPSASASASTAGGFSSSSGR